MPIVSPDLAQLSDILQDCSVRAGVAGAQVSVIGPQGRADAVWGQASPGRALEVDDRIQVGSLSKVLNAVLVHQLVDDERLRLHDDVAHLAIDAGDRELTVISGVSVGQLLSMTSGLDWGVWAAGDSVEEAVRAQLALPRRASAGTFGYSFAGTMIAARLVELLRGTSWWDAVLDHIARPLQLGLSDQPDSPGHEPTAAGWSLVEAGRLAGMAPTGTTLSASAADLVTLAFALAHPSGPLLTPASHRALHDPVVHVGAPMCADSWCHGPYARRAESGMIHGHGGRWASGVSDLSWQTSTRTAVAIVTNTPSRGGELVRELSRAIHPLLWGDDAFVETVQADAVDPSCATAELDALTGRYATATRLYEVRRRGDRLVVLASSLPTPTAVFLLPDAELELTAVGPRRFLPAHESRDERRLQEFWFSMEATPDHFYDGFVACERLP